MILRMTACNIEFSFRNCFLRISDRNKEIETCVSHVRRPAPARCLPFRTFVPSE